MPQRSVVPPPLLLRACRFPGETRLQDVLIEKGRIAGIGAGRKAAGIRNRGAATMDLEGRFLVPGFVDLHTHGAVGVDFVEADDVEFARAMEHYLSRGVTSILVSLYPKSWKASLQVVRRIAGYLRDGIGRQVAMGIHLEGPFLNPGKPGALPRSRFRAPSVRDAASLLEAGDGFVRTVTVAPELKGGLELARYLHKNGVVAAFGHSLAGYEETRRAIDKGGVRYATHLFNAMSGLHHRDPGAVGALLENPDVAVEIISDGHHVSVPAMRLAQRLKPKDKVILVSDSVHPCGLRDGLFEFAGVPVKLERGLIRQADGTLSGSALSLDEALRVQVHKVGTELEDALRGLTENPAKAIGLERKLGSIAPRRVADLAVLDERLRVVGTFKGGELVYRKPSLPQADS